MSATRLLVRGNGRAVPVLRAWPSHTSDGVEMMRVAVVAVDTAPDALQEAAGICPVFRLERAV